jgi:hypothetical protein
VDPDVGAEAEAVVVDDPVDAAVDDRIVGAVVPPTEVQAVRPSPSAAVVRMRRTGTVADVFGSLMPGETCGRDAQF